MKRTEALTFTALDWQYQPREVKVTGRVLESAPQYNLFLTCDTVRFGWLVFYGLQVVRHEKLSHAAQAYENCLAHAKTC